MNETVQVNTKAKKPENLFYFIFGKRFETNTFRNFRKIKKLYFFSKNFLIKVFCFSAEVATDIRAIDRERQIVTRVPDQDTTGHHRTDTATGQRPEEGVDSGEQIEDQIVVETTIGTVP